MCQYHRTVFDLDFHQDELMLDLHPEISTLSTASTALRSVAKAVLSGGAQPYWVKGEKTSVVLCNLRMGRDYIRWLPAFIHRFHQLGLSNLLIFVAIKMPMMSVLVLFQKRVAYC